MRKLYVLLAAWCVFVVIPGLLVAVGAFGDVYFHWRGGRLDNAGIPGGATAGWIVGYVVQLGLFMSATSIARKQSIFGWLAAVAFPWGVNWTLYGATWLAAPWFLVTAAVAISIAIAARRADTLEHHGVRAKGIVLEVREPLMNVVVNNVYIKRKLRLRIERDDDVPSYEGVLDGLFMLGRIPEVGDAIRLRVDPENPQHLAAVKEETAPRRAAHEPRTPRGGGIADELERLARLRDRGDITEAELAAAKRKVLGKD